MITDPHEPSDREESFAKNAVDEEFFLALNRALLDADLPQPKGGINVETIPLIYIVGAPRSGTTLLSQLMSRFLPFGYINNLIARFWARPSVGIFLSQTVLGRGARNHISFESSFGTTAEPYGPHEFGYFWRYWLKFDDAPTHHLTEELISAIDRDGLKNVLEQEIIGSFMAPVVFKNVICGFHASFLTSIHAKALFLHISRDTYETAASILCSRKRRYGSYSAWWSLKPSSYPFNGEAANAAAEVAMQVTECRREIDEELSKPGVKSMHVSYEDLCHNPKAVILKICDKLKEMNTDIEPLNHDFPQLKVSSQSRLPSSLEFDLRKYLQR
jgi:LPS sulfotransferase NodH